MKQITKTLLVAAGVLVASAASAEQRKLELNLDGTATLAEPTQSPNGCGIFSKSGEVRCGEEANLEEVCNHFGWEAAQCFQVHEAQGFQPPNEVELVSEEPYEGGDDSGYSADENDVMMNEDGEIIDEDFNEQAAQ